MGEELRRQSLSASVVRLASFFLMLVWYVSVSSSIPIERHHLVSMPLLCSQKLVCCLPLSSARRLPWVHQSARELWDQCQRLICNVAFLSSLHTKLRSAPSPSCSLEGAVHW